MISDWMTKTTTEELKAFMVVMQHEMWLHILYARTWCMHRNCTLFRDHILSKYAQNYLSSLALNGSPTANRPHPPPSAHTPTSRIIMHVYHMSNQHMNEHIVHISLTIRKVHAIKDCWTICLNITYASRIRAPIIMAFYHLMFMENNVTNYYVDVNHDGVDRDRQTDRHRERDREWESDGDREMDRWIERKKSIQSTSLGFITIW